MEKARVEVKTRLAGLFYRSPSPEAPPFVEVGTAVEKGQTIALVESMKMFTTIKSPESGTIVEIAVENEEAVNPGQVLMRLERAG